jgi:hypothetical protein
MIFEEADGILGKKARNAATKNHEKALCLIERRRGLYKNYLCDRSYENKTNVKKVQKALKYELRRFEVEAIDKIAEDLEDVARRHITVNFYTNMLKI